MSFGHPVSILDNLFHLLFTCKSIVSEQFGHRVLEFSSDLDTLFINPGKHLESKWNKKLAKICLMLFEDSWDL